MVRQQLPLSPAMPQSLNLPRLRPRQVAILEACLIGLVSGLAAFFLKQTVGWLGSARQHMAGAYPAFLVLPLIGIAGGGLAGWLIDRFAPSAAGSGIPQVKMALAGIPTPLNGKVAIVKLLSTMVTLGSGFGLGRQGPTVQISAAIADQISRLFPTSPEHRRQLLACGAAAGLAAGFNAPIAGVLFVVEELLQDVSGLTLGTAIVASFIGAVVSRLLGGAELSLELVAMKPQFLPQQIPLFLLLGVLAGLLGILLVQGIILSLKVNQKLKLALPWRIALAGGITGLVLACLPAGLRDNANLQQVLVNSLLDWRTIALIFVVKFGLTLLATGASAPGGLFAPSLILGSALGYLVGHGAQAFQAWSGLPLGASADVGFVTTFALAGMGAFFSAVTRGPITAIVIVFEITTDFGLVLPLMISSVTAYLIGESIASGSVYKYLLDLKGISIQPNAPTEPRLAHLRATDMMQRNVETLSVDMPIEQAIQAFNQSHHRGFPVIDRGELIGIVTQTDLTRETLHDVKTLRDVMTENPVVVRPNDRLSHVLYQLNRYKISRLPVVDRHKLVGIITRADIIRAESERLAGETAPEPEASYCVYQTRDPEIGLGRILVPIANPATAQPLLQIAAALAKHKHYELECLQVIIIPRHLSPAETPVSLMSSRQMLDRADQLAKQWDISVHTQIRVAHDVPQAVTETIRQRTIDLLVMGWSGDSVMGYVYGNTVDRLIRSVTCQLVLAKLPLMPRFNQWLLPTAGGPNSRQALRLLPGLIQLSDRAQINLCNIQRPSQPVLSPSPLHENLQFLEDNVDSKILATTLQGENIAQTVIDRAQAQNCDVILLGATQSGLLEKMIQGNIPEAIAREFPGVVLLVRDRI
jgi:chloride channel protein, CIC family